MFDVFEQPWTLVGAAILVLFGVLTFRSIFPEKQRRWQWLLPVLVVGLAFGLDGIVQTDLEKIDAVLDKGVTAVKEQDALAIGSILSDQYSDSFHATKQGLINHFKRVLSEPMIAGHKERGRLVDIKGSKATVVLFTTITFKKNSRITKTKLTLQRQPDGRWLIGRAEVLELNKQPVNWSHI
jgi:hypothetical protein